MSLGYGAEKSWAILKGVDLDGSAFVITDTDIEVYNWSTHTINLTPIASSRFKDTFGGEGSSIYLDHRAFVVTLNGERLYGGLFLQISSAMAIDYPVIYPETYQLDKVLLSIRPTHRFGEIDPSRVHEIEFEAIYEHFNAQGKLAQ